MFTDYIRSLFSRVKIILYKISGRRPWSRGYSAYKINYIKETLDNHEIMARFENATGLPKNFGYALDERAVEYPWLFSRISGLKAENILDAGSILNFEELLKHSSLKGRKITIATLSPEADCFWYKGVSYLFTDLRLLPFKDNCFDCIVCVSTIEHIGFDNSIYTKDARYKEEKFSDFEKVILELKRVLKNGGHFFITTPFGKRQNFQRFQQFDSELIEKILDIFAAEKFRINYYKYTKGGWDISSEGACKDAEYFDIYKTKYFDKKFQKDIDDDFAAAARAVVCLDLTKK